MKRKVWSVICVTMLFFSQISNADDKVTEAISVSKKGVMKIGSINIGVRCFFVDWRRGIKQTKSFFPTDKNSENNIGVWSWSGDFGEDFQMTENITRLSGRKIGCKYRLASSQGIPTEAIYVDVTLPLAEFIGRNIEVDGKKIMLPKQFKKLFLLQSLVKEIVIHSEKGKIIIFGDGIQTHIQDNRKYDSQTVSIRLHVKGVSQNIVKDASIDFTVKVKPYDVNLLDIRNVVNLGFKDEKAGDGRGGWTDQGPNNDLRMLKPGKRVFGPVPFDIIDANKNNGRSCIVLEGPHKKMFPSEVTVVADGQKHKYLYLLHATGWTPSGKVQYGDIVARFNTGEEKIIPVTAWVDCANWWMPTNLRNGSVVWTGENKTSYVGLYLSRFELEDKPLKCLTFRSNKKAYWMIPAVSLSNDKIYLPQTSGTFYVVENKDWKSFEHKFGIERGSVLDFSDFERPVIGKDSWVINKNGRFVASDNPQVSLKLVGPNLCFSANIMEKANVDKLVDAFVRMGYNSVRLHHFDGAVLKGGNRAKASDDISPEILDRFDYTFYKMKNAGLYVTTDLYCNRRLGKNEIFGWDNPVKPSELKALIPILPSAFEAWKKFVIKLMNHVNPYTGIAWKDDPALFAICPVNEDTIQWRVNKSPEIKALYMPRFKKWLDRNDFSANTNKGEDQVLFNLFLNDIKTESNRRVEKFLRGLGVKALLTSCNVWSKKEMAFERDELDYIDNHSYWEHPQFIGKKWSLPTSYAQKSATKSTVANIRYLAGSRVFGKPFTVTEFQHCSPNRYRAEGGALFGAYAALQNWSALYRFAWAHSERTAVTVRPVGGFDMAADPLGLLSERLIILMFRRGDVSPAQRKIVYGVTREDACSLESGSTFGDFSHTGLVAQVGSMALPKGRTISQKFDTVTSDISLTEEHYGDNEFLLSKEARKKYIPDESCIKSDTGEIELMATRGILKVVTPKTECFVTPEDNEIIGDCLKAKIKTTFATVAASAVDDKVLAESKRILVLHLTDIKNTKMKFRSPRMSILEKYGTLPHLVRRGTAEIRIRNSNAGMKIWAVDITGKRMDEVNARYENGEYVFTAETCPANAQTRMVYELADK